MANPTQNEFSGKLPLLCARNQYVYKVSSPLSTLVGRQLALRGIASKDFASFDSRVGGPRQLGRVSLLSSLREGRLAGSTPAPSLILALGSGFEQAL